MPTSTTLNQTVQAIINNTAPVQLSARPVPTPLPPGLATTALDWQPIPVFGVSLWAIISLLSFAALVVVIFHWYDKSGDLNAIKPWFIKIKKLALGKMQVIRISRAGNFIPDCLTIFDNILSYDDSEENINQWRLNSPEGVIRVGGIPAAVISEDSDTNRDFLTEIALCHAAEHLNENIEGLRTELNERHKELVQKGEYPEDAENPANLIHPIHSGRDYIGQEADDKDPVFQKSGRLILQLLFPEGIYIPAINYFNQNNFRKFWFKGTTAAAFGGENLRIVDDEYVKKSETPKGFFQQYGAMLIGALVCLGCIIGGAVLPLG